MTNLIDPSLFWRPRKLYKIAYQPENFNRIIFPAVGGRSIGKTYGFERYWLLERFFEFDEEFLFIRRYGNDFGNIGNFFKKFELAGEDPQYWRDWTVEKLDKDSGEFKFKGKTAGYYSSFTKLMKKGQEFEKVGSIFFDEFIAQPGVRYIKDEFTEFLEIVSTVCRYTRRVPVLMSSNTVSCYNPYFLAWDYQPIDGIWFGPGSSGFPSAVVLERCRDNPKLIEAMLKTPFGRMISGTTYGDYALYNESLQESRDYIVKDLTRYCFPLARVIQNEIDYTFWCDNKSIPGRAVVYANYKAGDGRQQVFAVTLKDQKPGMLNLREFFSSPEYACISNAFDKGYLFYEDATLQGAANRLFVKGLDATWR